MTESWLEVDACLSTAEDRLQMPPSLPAGLVFNISAIGLGWCELTTRTVAQPAFAPIELISRHRITLPPAATVIFGELGGGRMLCVSIRSGDAVEALQVDLDIALRALASFLMWPAHWRSGDTSPWRP